MKKYLTVLVAILLLAVLMSCSNDSHDRVDIDAVESERTTITLGIINQFQLYEVDYTRWHVGEFNRDNEYYYVEIVNYADEDLMRLRTELVAGSGPDILYTMFMDYCLFGPIINQGIFADLWSFIDDDPDISREDFFHHILELNQSPGGGLYTIANQFTIETLISMSGIINYPEYFTITKFFELVRSVLDDGIACPMDEFMSGSEFLLTVILFTDLGIIDLDNNVSHFVNNQTFHDLLELASLFPREWIHELSGYGFISPLLRLRRGEQIFMYDSIRSPLNFIRYEVVLGDFTVLGFPSDEGGIHGALFRSNFGINANSNHTDAAWSFIRRYLLSNAQMNYDMGLPMRIDLFHEQVEIAVTEGRSEIDIGIFVARDTFDDGADVPMHTLTEKGADELLELIEAISFVSRYNYTIANILLEELPHFLDGNQTAEDTARILQNRVQIYLNERS